MNVGIEAAVRPTGFAIEGGLLIDTGSETEKHVAVRPIGFEAGAEARADEEGGVAGRELRAES